MSRIALITGGQQGIGFGIAEALAGAGFAVALASEVAPDAPAVRSALERLGANARYIRHDVQDIERAPDLIDRVEAELGPITTFASNAGVTVKVRGDMLELEADSFDRCMGVNLRGAFFLAQTVARRMAAQTSEDYRSMIFTTSVNAEMASIDRAEYAISKAGASMMARLFALRLAPLGIGVFELRPGVIETAMTAAVKDKYTARIEDGLVPAGRWGYPSDIGSVVVPLAEGKFAFATGAAIPIDGGLSIARI
jgi:NAD(P)-dependent dehydrogenase (short-subunit alcohol dehydrogenase family)